MAIPNVANLYQKIHRGAEGGNEFARIIDSLLIADAEMEGYKYEAYSDRAGDYKGVDGIKRQNGKQIGIQCKFYPSPLYSEQKGAIKSSLLNAIKKFPEMDEWVLIIPIDPHLNDKVWFDELKEECKCNAEIRGHKYIMELMVKHKHIGGEYYEELRTVNHQTVNNNIVNNNVQYNKTVQLKEKGSNAVAKGLIIFFLLVILGLVINWVINSNKPHKPAIIENRSDAIQRNK